MRKHVERWYPLVLAVIIGVVFYRKSYLLKDVPTIIDKLMTSAITICGALLGFLLTILTIINSIDTRTMRIVKSSGAFGLLNSYLRVAIMSNIVTISITFLLPAIFSLNDETLFRQYVYSILVSIVAYTWFANMRFSFLFVRTLTDN